MVISKKQIILCITICLNNLIIMLKNLKYFQGCKKLDNICQFLF